MTDISKNGSTKQEPKIVDTYPYERPFRLRILAACTDADWFENIGHVAARPEYFNTKEEQTLIRFINTFRTKYNRTPCIDEIIAEFPKADTAMGDLIVDVVDTIETSDLSYAKDEAVKFARIQARWLALDRSISLFQQGKEVDDIWKLFEEADNVGKIAGWNTKTVDPNFIYRPTYLAGDLCAAGWLVIFYGSAKCLKSMLVQDMVVCAANTRTHKWLEPIEEIDNLVAMDVTEAKTLYIDFDNGNELLEGHMAAAFRAHNLPEDSVQNIHIESFPTNPEFSALNDTSIQYLIKLIKQNGYTIIVIDHLLNASGAKDEKSSEMATAIANLRRIVKETGVLLIAIAHTPKDIANTTVRGHGSITDGADMTYLVEREAGTDTITVTCTNARHYKPEPFSAAFIYKADPNDKRILLEYTMARVPYQFVKNSQDRGKSEDDKKTQADKWVYDNANLLLDCNMTEAKKLVCDGCDVGGSYADNAIIGCINNGVFTKMQVGKNKVLKPGDKFPQPEIQLKGRLLELRNVEEHLERS